MSILLIGQRNDPHIDAVHQRLLEGGSDVEILDTVEEIPETKISVKVPGVVESNLINSGTSKSVDWITVSAVWWRVKPPIIRAKPPTVETLANTEFRKREWTHAIIPLESILPKIKWINSPIAQLKAGHKLYQLELAQQANFQIPRTLISNDPAEVRSFISECRDDAVYKPLTAYRDPLSPLITFTTAVTRQSLAEQDNPIMQAPGIYQENIKKAYELRITVIGDNVFAVKILSQDCPGAEQDWRKEIDSVQYDHYSLPADIDRKLRTLNNSLNLSFCAYDFIVDQQGRYVFLEANPAGQWLWLENKLQLPIADALSQTLQRID